MKYKSITTVLIASCLLNIQTLIAQDSSRNISLKEAIDLSIKNSKLLKNNKAKIDEATAFTKEATEKRLPDASISGGYMYLPVAPNVKISGSSSGGPKVSQAIYGIASVSLPIYTGGKLNYAIESAKYLEQATKLDADNNKEDIILNTIEAYSNLYKSKATVAIVKENLQQANQRATDFSNLEKNGLVTKNDLLKVQLQASNIELSLFDAESNYKIANINMALMLGLPEQTILTPDSASLQETVQVKTVDEYEQQAFQSRKDIAALSTRKKAATLGVKSVKADYYPNVALTGGYIAADIPKFITITNAVNIGVGVKYNLASLWKTKSKIAEANAKVSELTANEEMLNDHIRLEINQAYQQYLLSQKKIEVYQKAVELSEENYRILKNKYNNALATTTELLEADVTQLQAKLNKTNAIADATVSYNKLLKTAGQLNN